MAGRQAVRVQGAYTGEGLYPSGTRVTTWLVDLDPGTDDEAGILVGSTHQGETIDYPHAVDVLDAMASAVIVADNPAGQAGVDAVLALSSDTVTVAAGMVSVDVDQILVERDGREILTGTVPVSLEGGWAMAVPIEEGDVLHAVDAEGDTLATAAFPSADFEDAR